MTADEYGTVLDQAIIRGLQEECAAWTPECPDIETWMDFAANGTSPDAPVLREHLALCAYCRREYAQLVRDFRLADAFQEAKRRRDLIFTPAVTDSLAGMGQRAVHIYSGLAAATDKARIPYGIFCEGALLVQVLREDGGETILIAQNNTDGFWESNQDQQPELRRGIGIDLAGTLIRFDVETGGEAISGYFVLSQMSDAASAELSLGSYGKLDFSAVTCRIASPAELQNAAEVAGSIARLEGQRARLAWLDYANRHTDVLAADVLAAIKAVTGTSHA